MRAATATKHELGLSSCISCCLVRLSNGGLGPLDETALSLPACTQRSVFCGAAPASRLDPLAFSGVNRGRSKAVVSLCSAVHTYRCRTCQFFVRPGELGPTDEIPQRQPQKSIISARISFAARATIVPLLDWLLACVANDFFCNPENPDALGDDFSFFAVTQQQWRACVRRMRCRRLDCVLPPSSLDPRSQELLWLRRMKVVTDFLETDAH